MTVDDLQAKRTNETEPFEGPRRRLTAALTTARLLNEGGLAFGVATGDSADTRVGWQSLQQHLDPTRWKLEQ